QRLTEFGLFDHVASNGGPAVRQKIALGVGAFFQFIKTVLPVEGDAGSYNITLLRRLDRRLQQAVQSKLTMVAQDRRPRIDRTGNGDRMRGGERDRTYVVFEIPFRRGRLRRAP